MNSKLFMAISQTHLTPAATPRRRGLWHRTLAFGLALAATAYVSRPVLAAAPKPEPLTVTVYSSADPAGFDPQQWVYNQRIGYNNQDPAAIPGFGVVKEMRTISVKQGLNTVDFSDVAALIDPTSVSFEDLTTPATSVLEQQFKFDLISSDKLLQKYLGRTVSLSVPNGSRGTQTVSGKLLSASNSLVVQTANGLRIISPGNLQQIKLGPLPKGLMIKPTLQWQLLCPTAGKQQVLTSYETKGLTWIADYNLVLNGSDNGASLSAWVTLLNLSGKTYRDARLKLIAGNVHRIQPPRPIMMYARLAASNAAENQQVGFQQKSFFEYHMYTLPRLTTIRQNSTEQIALFSARPHIAVKKVLVYAGQPTYLAYGGYAAPDLYAQSNIQSSNEVDVFIRFMNSKANSLGVPFPKGKMRVFKADPADGTLEFVGEDLIHNTPKDEPVLIKVGKAFDIIGKRTQTNFHVNSAGHEMTESFKIDLHNHSKAAVHVLVREYLFRWNNWKITAESDKFKKINSRTIEFPVDVPANGAKTVTYTVKYTW
ncbi:MAG: DUF4139 domain-containing protein [Phycisphaerales bacterium]|nr:DUF4139 domain-containing protein [Phycisphaerales bacterium]